MGHGARLAAALRLTRSSSHTVDTIVQDRDNTDLTKVCLELIGTAKLKSDKSEWKNYYRWARKGAEKGHPLTRWHAAGSCTFARSRLSWSAPVSARRVGMCSASLNASRADVDSAAVNAAMK